MNVPTGASPSAALGFEERALDHYAFAFLYEVKIKESAHCTITDESQNR
jgi:hypothetical protein